MYYLEKLNESEKKRLEDIALRMVMEREGKEKATADRKAKEESERPQREYINRLCDGIKPKSTEGILAMNYCIVWQKAWGKTLQDWISNGFHRVPYGRKMSPVQRKYVQYKMELV